ncbi:MAG: Hsp20 family protein [Methylocella sp.]
MRQFDLSPLYRSTIGFDRLFNMLDQAAGLDAAPSYPPYDIERTGEDAYRISIAVAGFAEKELAVETKDNTLSVRGLRCPPKEGEQTKAEMLYRGIASRAFERRFQLADHVLVTSASLENGLLHIDLLREVPEARKPRQIPIGTSHAEAGPQVVSTQKAA